MSKSMVWSCNEWDPLEEIVVGNPLRARFPMADPSTRLAEFPDRSLEEIPQGSFPQQIIDETEEDLLDKAWGLEPDSRLSCQAIVDDEDLVVEIPKYTINMVSERH